MDIYLGTKKSNPKELVKWESTETINSHWLIVGASGTGKTYQLKNLIKQLLPQNVRLYVFDVHGDIDVNDEFVSVVRLSESSPYGINPLIISADIDFGGVRKKIGSFLNMMQRYTSQMDSQQLAVIRNALKDLYEERGIYSEEPETWHNRENMPNLQDLHAEIRNRLRGFLRGIVNKTKDSIEDDVENYLKYESEKVLRDVYNKLDELQSKGIFKDNHPVFEREKPVWKLDIKALSDEEQGYVVEIMLEDIFFEAKKSGLKDDTDTFVIIDEAHKFISTESTHIINIMMREARKFGIGLIFASQSYSHFSEDIISNCASKLILGIDELYHDTMARKFGVEVNRIRLIQPHKTALCQMKAKRMLLNNRFTEIYVVPFEQIQNSFELESKCDLATLLYQN